MHTAFLLGTRGVGTALVDRRRAVITADARADRSVQLADSMIGLMLVATSTANTFKSCEVPEFEWAVYGTRTTGRMYAMKAAITGNHLFAGGFVKSTLDSEQEGFAPIDNDYAITGPYTATDFDGSSAATVTVDLESYPTSGGAAENAGGSWRAYEVGVAKVDISTGTPVDMFVYHGDGMDEASGMAASNGVLAISGHFTGNLSAEMADGSTTTIRNSNIAPGELPDPADQFHPNQKDASVHTGVDDGFVIKASADTGKAAWLVHYPQTNSDAQVVGVDVDESGNVFGSGYECSVAENATEKVCHGFIAKFASSDGALVWEQKFEDLGAALWLKYDSHDEAIYFTGTTTYSGKASADGKVHVHCEHSSCAVTGRLSATDGATHWLRTFQASPRWGVFDQSGDIELAVDADGPYIYAAFDDAGENGAVTLDAGTPYKGCKAADGTVTPEYSISTSDLRLFTASDCPSGSTFVEQTDADAVPAAAAKTYALCGNKAAGDACIIKYHKYTGKPVWARDMPMISGLAPLPDGQGVMVTGWYYYGWAASGRTFDSLMLPGYLRVGGLGSQKWGIYNAKLATGTGSGAYVLHSGGGMSDRVNDMVSDDAGNVYNVGYMKNRIMNWGGPGGLQTKIIEQGGSTVEDTGTSPVTAEETHMFVAKLASATEATPSCLETCADTTDTATVTAGHCFIDGVCYADGATAEAFGASCHVCSAATSQTEWTAASSLGTTHCFIDDICWADGEFVFTQRRTHSAKVYSSCQHCAAAQDATAWSVTSGFELVDGSCATVSPSPPPHVGTFTDDEGTTHTWSAAVPTIVTGAFQAMTLMDMGLPASQIVGTFGERGTAGSNANGIYANYNAVDHGDHANAPYDPSHFHTDPTEAEQELLSQMIDLSPDCSHVNNYCSSFNITRLDMHGWPDLIVAGPLFAQYIITADVVAAAAQHGVPIIYLTDKTTPTFFKSFIEMAQRFETLAEALGADVEAAVAADKQRFCSNAAAFREAARSAADRGVRALAGVMPYGPADPDSGAIGGWLQSPDKNPALMMLEELGMQILHVDTAQSSYYEAHFAAGWPNYGGTMSATNLMSSGSLDGTPVPYPVDFFLYEPRGALDFTSAAFATAWPHPAVVAEQYAVYPITTLHYSYRHAADVLEGVGNKLKDAAKLNTMATACTNINVIDGEHYRTTGLPAGEYACSDPIEYGWCPVMSPPSAPPASDTLSSALSDSADLTKGEVAGVAIGCIIVGVLLGFLSGRAVARPKFAVSTKTEMVGVTKA